MAITVPEHQLVYMALPKAACSSIKAGLALIDPKVDIGLEEMADANKVIHRLYQTDRFRPRRWKRFNGWFRFTVVRDPLKRLMSVIPTGWSSGTS